MAKMILGVDIGNDSLKLALVSGGVVKKTAVTPMPNGLVRDGRVVSPESMSELIRKTMKASGIRCNKAALVLGGEAVFVRNVSMPWMSHEQLEYNLPFEFRDYITEELKDYVCDYAMISTPEELRAKADLPAEEGGKTMELMAVAAPVELIEELRLTLRKSGLKLVKAAPPECCYTALIRARERAMPSAQPMEYCILDLGFRAIRMYMFRSDCHVVTRVLEIGLSSLDDVIADHYNVDVHLAHTYLLRNYENCQAEEFCTTAYGNISVELMRALNFYRFSNPDSRLSDVWVCGGGAVIRPLQEAIRGTLDMQIHMAQELVPGGAGIESCESLVQAVGITLD